MSLPELGIDAVKAKVDTGARSSSLHAYAIRDFERDGVAMVRFKVHPVQRDTKSWVQAEAALLDRRLVRNPGGREELRPVISTVVSAGGASWRIELTLTSRDTMGFRMLLGRQAMRNRFVVDPGRSFILERPPSTQRGSP